MSRHTTVLSTKGQIILPKPVRDAHNWVPGTRLVVEDTADGILVKLERPARKTSLDEVVGMLKYDGPPVSLEEMDATVESEVLRRAKLGRY